MNSYNNGYLDAVVALRALLETKEFMLSKDDFYMTDDSLGIEVKTLKEAIEFLKLKVEDNEKSEN